MLIKNECVNFFAGVMIILSYEVYNILTILLSSINDGCILQIPICVTCSGGLMCSVREACYGTLNEHSSDLCI